VTLRLSRRLPGVIFAGALVYVFATNSQVVWLYLVSALFLALVPLSLITALVVARRLRLGLVSCASEGFIAPLTQDRAKVFVGDTLKIRLRIEPGGDARRVSLTRIRLGDGREVAATTSNDGTTVLIEIPIESRGRVDIAAVHVNVSWPVGLLTVRRWMPLDVSVLAHPRYLVPSGERRAGGGFTGDEAHRRGPGDEFIGLREYQRGDSRRRIHWPTTARSGRLMVVETSIETERPARYQLVLLRNAGEEARDLAVSLAASLAAAEAARSEPFRLKVGTTGRELRRWPETLGYLATVDADLGAIPPRDIEVTQVAADGNAVRVEGRHGGHRFAAGTSLDDARAELEKLR
jgi:uncharacterized protein (DUF58 family)